MTIKEIQLLNTGDKVSYHNYSLEIVDWNCHNDVVMFGNERIFAEPVFNWIDKNNPKVKLPKRGIHPSFWNEIQKI